MGINAQHIDTDGNATNLLFFLPRCRRGLPAMIMTMGFMAVVVAAAYPGLSRG